PWRVSFASSPFPVEVDLVVAVVGGAVPGRRRDAEGLAGSEVGVGVHGVVDGIDAGAAVDRVGRVAAVEHVVTVLALEAIVVGAAREGVVAAPAPELAAGPRGSRQAE